MLISSGERRLGFERIKCALRKILSNASGREPATVRVWALQELEAIGDRHDNGLLWLELCQLSGLEPKDRINAAIRAIEYPEIKKQALASLHIIASTDGIEVASRIEAARQLLANSGCRLPSALVELVKSFAEDSDLSCDCRAAATTVWAFGSPAVDPAIALYRLGNTIDRALRFACCEELTELHRESRAKSSASVPCENLVTLNAAASARRLLLELIRDSDTPQEETNRALWLFARLSDWDELTLAAELGEIRGESLDTLLAVFVEMRQSFRASPLVKQMMIEPRPWPEKRARWLADWAARHPDQAELLTRELEGSNLTIQARELLQPINSS